MFGIKIALMLTVFAWGIYTFIQRPKFKKDPFSPERCGKPIRTLSARERMAVPLAYRLRSEHSNDVYLLDGELRTTGTSGDVRTYIDGVEILIHECFQQEVFLTNRAEVVRHNKKMLVVSMEGRPLLPKLLVNPDEIHVPELADISADERLNLATRRVPEAQARVTHWAWENAEQADLRRNDVGWQCRTNSGFAAACASVGLFILTLCLGTGHPIISIAPVVFIAFACRRWFSKRKMNSSTDKSAIFRMHGRFYLFEPYKIRIRKEQEQEREPLDAFEQTLALVQGAPGYKGPNHSEALNRRVLYFLAGVRLRFPAHWRPFVAEQHEHSAIVDTVATGEVVRYNQFSIYEEARQFPSVHWVPHLIFAVGLIPSAIAAYSLMMSTFWASVAAWGVFLLSGSQLLVTAWNFYRYQARIERITDAYRAGINADGGTPEAGGR